MQNSLTRPPESFRDLWDLVLLATLAVLLIGLLLWPAWNWLDRVGSSSDFLTDAAQTAFAAETGLRVLRVFTTANGGMIDLRYQVTDPDKAIIIHDIDNPPRFVNEATGEVIDRAYHDHSSGSSLKAGQTYNEILVNEGGVIQRGDRITIFVGQSRLEHIVVQ